jgi:hypothetical protein
MQHVYVKIYFHRKFHVPVSSCSLNYRHQEIRYPCYRPWRPLGLREVEAPTLLRQTSNRWRQGCQPYAPSPSKENLNTVYRFLSSRSVCLLLEQDKFLCTYTWYKNANHLHQYRNTYSIATTTKTWGKGDVMFF